MIDELLLWAEKERSRLESGGTSVDVGRTEGRTDVVHVNLDSKAGSVLGQIIIWERCMCDVDVLDVGTGQSILLEHHEPKSFDDLIPIIENVVQFVDKSDKSRT